MFRLWSSIGRIRLLPIICAWGTLAAPLQAENILLVSVDTLRADRLSCYGYKGNRTSNIDRWASEGVLFQRAFTESPLTLPSHSTILTGTFPPYHGVRENVGFALQDKYLTLPEVLVTKGYDTAGFIGAYVLASEFGISQGFKTFDEEFPDHVQRSLAPARFQRPAEQVTDRFLEWVDRCRKPFFALVHYFDPHVPRPNGYDWEVSRVDRCIGRIDAYLRGSGLLEETHIILLSDHGESLGDHGESGHGFFVYDSTLRVPLIIRPAISLRLDVKTVTEPVSLADVAPTILQMVKLSPPPAVQGRSLLRLMFGKSQPEEGLYAETYIPLLHFGWSPLRSCRMGRYKYIDAPQPELYDIHSDPGETTNLYNRNRALGDRYREWLESFAGRFGDPVDASVVSVSPESRERLAALGYVGLNEKGSANAASFGRGIDPKDRIVAFEACHKVLNDLGARRVSNAVLEEIKRIRKWAPELEGLTYLEARAHDQLGETELAERKYRQLLEENPEHTAARFYLARILEIQQRPGEAEKQLLLILESDPDHYPSRNNLAGLYRKTGQIPSAIEQMEIIVAQHPSYVPGWQNLGQLYMEIQDWKRAGQAFRRALELNDDNALVHFNLARVLRALGRSEEADREMRTAIELDPRIAQYKSP